MTDVPAVWLLTVSLWTGGPEVISGPFSEADCITEGETWERRALHYVARNPRLYKRPRSLPYWHCFPEYPDLPKRRPTFPTLLQGDQ